MSFEDLENRLKKFFNFFCETPEEALKNRIRTKTLEVFNRKKQQQTKIRWMIFRQKLSLSFSLVLIVSVLGFINFPFSQKEEKEVVAGKIEITFGPVELIRGNKSFLVKDSSDILVGDLVKIGNNGEAKLTLTNQLVAIAKDKTQFRITDKDALFLKEGFLTNEVFRGAEIATDRGFVKSANGSSFEVVVSETGETTVSPNKNLVKVYDLNEGQIALSAGDKIVLRSDTQLSETKTFATNDLKLSNSQLASIYAKLVITRTKLLTGVDKLLVDNKKEALRDISSSQKTFVSITQVLQTTREMELARRKNLKNLSVEFVLEKMSQRTENTRLLAEIKAVETLFTILSQNRGKIAFSPQKAGVESFDRYSTLRNLISLGSEQQQTESHLLLQKYAVNFLRKVQNSELRIEQISVLNSEIDKLPKTPVAKEFLAEVDQLLPSDLSEILEEKIDHLFEKTI